MLALFLLTLLCLKSTLGRPRTRRRPLEHHIRPLFDRKKHKFTSLFGGDVISNCTEYYFSQPLDHYNWNPAPNGQVNYQQRYFVCGGKNWKPNNTIWFYPGNEADVELYINETGLMWENADSYNAVMVFAEHRYFGKSLPFGTNTKDMAVGYISFLSSDQALADYANLVQYLKESWNSFASPVIGFGGSYGGMLCTWFRTKYPQWIDGCIAGSAPVVAFMDSHPEINPNFFAQIETFDCTTAGGSNDLCSQNYRKSWDIIFNMSQTQNGRNELAQLFKLCNIPQTYEEGVEIAYWVTDAISYMTMGSYPYASSYMLNGYGTLPPYPQRVACDYLIHNFSNNNDLLEGIRQSAGVFYNYSGTLECFDTNSNANNETEIDGILWNYLACTEIFMPFGQDGINDMFWYSPYNETASIEACINEYSNSGPRPKWAIGNYGGWQIGTAGVSNIVFSNGELDPWRGGGITKNLSESLTSIIIPDAGHHIDLMFSNSADTQAIKNARLYELSQISKWINETNIKWEMIRKYE